MSNSNPALGWLLLIVLSVIWGMAYPLIHLSVEVFSPIQVAALRVTVGMTVLLPVVIRDFRKVTWREWGLMAIVGLLGNALPAFLFPLAQTKISSAEAGVLNSLSPVFILIVAWVGFGRKYPLINVFGILIGLAGAIVLMIGDGKEINLEGEVGYALFVVAATLCYGLSANLIKHYFQNTPPERLTAFALLSVGIPSAIFMFAGSGAPEVIATHPRGWEALLYVAILGAVMTAFAVVLFNRMLQVASLAFASSVTYTMPIVTIGWSLAIGEPLGWHHAAGLAIILVGVFLVNRK